MNITHTKKQAQKQQRSWSNLEREKGGQNMKCPKCGKEMAVAKTYIDTLDFDLDLDSTEYECIPCGVIVTVISQSMFKPS